MRDQTPQQAHSAVANPMPKQVALPMRRGDQGNHGMGHVTGIQWTCQGSSRFKWCTTDNGLEPGESVCKRSISASHSGKDRWVPARSKIILQIMKSLALKLQYMHSELNMKSQTRLVVKRLQETERFKSSKFTREKYRLYFLGRENKIEKMQAKKKEGEGKPGENFLIPKK